MPKNTLNDLNNHLFLQLERLSDEDLTESELEFEAQRAKAMSLVSSEIISNANLALKAAQFKAEELGWDESLPEVLTNRKREISEPEN